MREGDTAEDSAQLPGRDHPFLYDQVAIQRRLPKRAREREREERRESEELGWQREREREKYKSWSFAELKYYNTKILFLEKFLIQEQIKKFKNAQTHTHSIKN